MATTISAKQLLNNFLDLYPDEHWDKLPHMSENERFEERLKYIDKLLGEDVNGDNAAECFGLSFWGREDNWIPFDESIKNPWLNCNKKSPCYGHPLSFTQLRRKLCKDDAIIAEWLTKAIRLAHNLGEHYPFDLREIIPTCTCMPNVEWTVENTFNNEYFKDFIANSPYKRIVSYVIGIAMFYNHKNRVFKGHDFYDLYRTHFTQWQYMRSRRISHEEYNEIMLAKLQKSWIF